MNTNATSKCVFCTFTRSIRQAKPSSRTFSSSTKQLARKSKLPSVKIPKAKLNKVPTIHADYLEKNFSPQQRAAIDSATKLVNNDNIKETDNNIHPWSMSYVDDLTHVDPVADHPIKAPWQNIDETSRLKTDDELNADLYDLMTNLPDNEDKAVEKWREFDQNMRLTVGKEEAERSPRTALAPELSKMGKQKPAKQATTSGRDGENGRQAEQEVSPALLRLMQMTGLSRQQIGNLRVTTLVRHRVVNQTRLGKIQKMYNLSVAGNGNGLVGIGEGKSEEANEALIQSQYRAIRNMQPVLRYENRTIFGDVDGKVSATELQLYARPPGFGLRCQQYIFEICKAAGISDLAARVTRARNPMNTIKATIQALQSQKDPEEIARARGKKMVDVRKVYYAGQV